MALAYGAAILGGDHFLRSGIDPNTFDPFITVRVQVQNGELYTVQSSNTGVYPKNALILERLAIMKVAPVGTKIKELGWRRTDDVFYLRFFDYELIR